MQRQPILCFHRSMTIRGLAACVLLLLFAGRADAQRLPSTAVPEHYDLSFAVDLARARFDGVETIRIRLTEPTSTIVLNAADIEFGEVTIGTGAAAASSRVTLDPSRETVTLSAAKPLARGM